MDILYYSNYCENCKKILQFISKNGLIEKINAICIDKKSIDSNGQIYIHLENGKKIMLPPNVHSVPALLIKQKNYLAIFGPQIMEYYGSEVKQKHQVAQKMNGEPVGIHIMPSSSGVSIMSEQYTLYDLHPDDLSAKSTSTKRPMYNYVSADHSVYSIPTPPDTYRPDKIGENVTVETLTQKRDVDISPPGLNVTNFGF